ncbi:MAG TPA: hypothetical protein VEF04_09025, partial [Blastocatellia bacterium]|nr:hypothetical protein [Blastocatellia bacterium]
MNGVVPLVSLSNFKTSHRSFSPCSQYNQQQHLQANCPFSFVLCLIHVSRSFFETNVSIVAKMSTLKPLNAALAQLKDTPPSSCFASTTNDTGPLKAKELARLIDKVTTLFLEPSLNLDSELEICDFVSLPSNASQLAEEWLRAAYDVRRGDTCILAILHTIRTVPCVLSQLVAQVKSSRNLAHMEACFLTCAKKTELIAAGRRIGDVYTMHQTLDLIFKLRKLRVALKKDN